VAQVPSLLPFAMQALSQGFHIFPVEPGGKTPIRIYQDRPKEDAPWTIKWSEVATNDPNKVAQWWSYAPMANIGIACKPSGLFVVDCDQPKEDNLLKDTQWEYLHDLFGPRVDGETVWDQVAERYGGDPSAVQRAFNTYQVATGSGGRHFYYRWPPEVQSSQDSIVRGLLDVRGNGGERGGYVLAAGSVTTSGRYTEDGGPGDGVHAAVRNAPGWLVRLCQYREPVRPPRPPFKQPRHMAFHGLVETVRSAPDGNLNNGLFWAARAACTDGMSEEECITLLAPEYVQLGGNGGHRQAEATIKSAYRNQRRKLGI
jgi:hypothetical protein